MIKKGDREKKSAGISEIRGPTSKHARFPVLEEKLQEKYNCRLSEWDTLQCI